MTLNDTPSCCKKIGVNNMSLSGNRLRMKRWMDGQLSEGIQYLATSLSRVLKQKVCEDMKITRPAQHRYKN